MWPRRLLLVIAWAASPTAVRASEWCVGDGEVTVTRVIYWEDEPLGACRPQTQQQECECVPDGEDFKRAHCSNWNVSSEESLYAPHRWINTRCVSGCGTARHAEIVYADTRVRFSEVDGDGVCREQEQVRGRRCEGVQDGLVVGSLTTNFVTDWCLLNDVTQVCTLEGLFGFDECAGPDPGLSQTARLAIVISSGVGAALCLLIGLTYVITPDRARGVASLFDSVSGLLGRASGGDEEAPAVQMQQPSPWMQGGWTQGGDRSWAAWQGQAGSWSGPAGMPAYRYVLPASSGPAGPNGNRRGGNDRSSGTGGTPGAAARDSKAGATTARAESKRAPARAVVPTPPPVAVGPNGQSRGGSAGGTQGVADASDRGRRTGGGNGG